MKQFEFKITVVVAQNGMLRSSQQVIILVANLLLVLGGQDEEVFARHLDGNEGAKSYKLVFARPWLLLQAFWPSPTKTLSCK